MTSALAWTVIALMFAATFALGYFTGKGRR